MSSRNFFLYTLLISAQLRVMAASRHNNPQPATGSASTIHTARVFIQIITPGGSCIKHKVNQHLITQSRRCFTKHVESTTPSADASACCGASFLESHQSSQWLSKQFETKRITAAYQPTARSCAILAVTGAVAGVRVVEHRSVRSHDHHYHL